VVPLDDEAFEVVIAKGDVKLRHLARDPQCVLVVFELLALAADSVSEGSCTRRWR